MKGCIYGIHLWHIELFWKTCHIFYPLLSWGCMYYGIYSVPFMVRCTSSILHVVPMMHIHLEYHELLILSQVGLTVCGCNQNLQIFEYRLIGEEKFLIV